ncbi:proteasome subunit beta type-7-like [Schistocerca americana]|uniref:proteasome subunit beta type-7-like n=1 Tax=Schistocerca americana TaxID=7009 RepID=UPI001F4F63AF|nr:proteasome subunit beta type-7-like [Schistocerca americana]XP_047117980.1 proteasome subunit beta type-7-like [Schistocerca piceifrons]XP_049787014.1 proteasome subunit beta type-7-like [Schistocerca cancellata]XP_049815704.1 proteasome subunit beta type-7-like [Schistocerca nitens]XP_049963243.1 proteasome subunit beta type-7-like [Schistocerca serialis cubense]
MASVVCPDISRPGFQFDNCRRNAFLLKEGFVAPKATKTGTTIVGIIYKDGVILGADTRATEDTIVSDKNCSKIHFLAPNMYCCGAGTAADTEMTTQMISSQLELHRLNTGRVVPVVTANRMLKQMLFRYQGYIGAALVLGGVDNTGPHLYCIYPHGSSDKLPYATMGSGSLAAMSVFESRWKPDMTEEEGKQLVRDAIAAGIFNDLGSGSNVDLCVIRKGSVDYLRPYDEANIKGKRQATYDFKKGTTAVLSAASFPIEIEELSVNVIDHGESMDTSS